MKYFKLPDLGEGLPEAEIVEWHIKEGDTVAVDQLLVSVETAKAIVEVPSPQQGIIAKLFGKEGDIIHTGEPLIEYANEQEQDSGTVVGKMAQPLSESADHFHIGRPEHNTQNTARATPAIRSLAKHLDVDINQIKGTGPEGVITTDDVERAKNLNRQAGNADQLSGTRRTMAKNMARAHAEVVPVTLYEEADIHKWTKGTDTTIRLIRAIGIACQEVPAMNAWFDGETLSRRIMPFVDLGVAVDTPEGLFVPVLRDITNRSSKNLRKGLNAIREDVKKRTIPAKELQGATITLSNFGTIAGKFASPIVVPPQVTIVGAGVTREQPVAYKSKVAIHPILPISITFDHRPITGGEAARFLNTLIKDLQKKK